MNDMNFSEVWDKARARLQTLLHPDVFARWIAVIQVEALENQVLTLGVENDFYQTWLEDNYLALIKSAVADAAGSELKIRFQVAPRPVQEEQQEFNLSPATPASIRPKPKLIRESVAQSLDSASGLNPMFTFDEFIVGPSNSFSHAAAMAVPQAPGRAYNPLFIYGGTGLGKTHLMQAIGHQVLRSSRAKVAYLSLEAFLNEYIDSLQKRTIATFRKKYRNVDLLLIDDIHFLGGKERLQEEFFHTFNALYDARKQIVMNSDRPAAEIIGLEQRLVSRFEWGLVTELQPPDLETRIAILRAKKEKNRLALADAALVYIAEHVRSNIRRLEGALTRAASYASLHGRDLPPKELDDLLRDVMDQEKREILTFDVIMRTVAEHYDVRLTDLTSKRRPQAIAFPRQVAMYLCRTLTSSSLPEIANVFGKTHATVLHAYRSIEARISTNPELQQTVSQLTHRLEHRSL